MRWTVLLGTAALALALAGTAQAGCWATVGLAATPVGVGAGEAWTAELTVLQHGRTPLPDATPAVVISNAAGEMKTFPAKSTSPADGRYEATVVFPSAGSWSVAVEDGFPVPECAQLHTFGTHAIAAGTPPAEPPPVAPEPVAAPNRDGGGVPVTALALGLGFGTLALAGAGLAVRARRARPTAPA
jgi:hypothetical protein